MFGLRVLSDALLIGGPLDGQHLRSNRGHLILAPGTDTVAIHHGWQGGVRGSRGQGGIPLYDSSYDPRSEPLDISIYRAHPDEVVKATESGGTWYVERLVYVASLPERERDIAEGRKQDFARQFSGSVPNALNLTHSNSVAQKIAAVTVNRMNNCPAYAAVHLRDMRDALVAELAPLYSKIGGFRNSDFVMLSKQGDETRA